MGARGIDLGFQGAGLPEVTEGSQRLLLKSAMRVPFNGELETGTLCFRLMNEGGEAVIMSAQKNADAGNLLKSFNPYQEMEGETYMNEQQVAHFTQILQNWKQELMEEVDRTVNHMQDEAANFPDPADRASQEEEFSLELRTRDRERKLIKKINDTLARIEEDDYGFCDSCGVEIGIRRLEARPTATLCIDCKTLAEIKERQLGS